MLRDLPDLLVQGIPDLPVRRVHKAVRGQRVPQEERELLDPQVLRVPLVLRAPSVILDPPGPLALD